MDLRRHFTLKQVNVVESSPVTEFYCDFYLVDVKHTGRFYMRSVGTVLKPLLVLCGSLALLVLGCTVTLPGAATVTPLPEPTPDGDSIQFSGPYSYSLAPNSSIPGTRITYQGVQNGVYVFSIGGQAAYRQLNDTINWRGVIAPSVVGDYRLRIRSETNTQLFLEGTVLVTVFNPAPLQIPITSLPATPPNFDNMPVNYNVPVGRRVPGTTLVYGGQQDGMALLTGSTAYPLYPVGNSVTWTGRLTGNVLLRYDLIVNRVDDNSVNLTGVARLWLLP